jgi:hypothetical protein
LIGILINFSYLFIYFSSKSGVLSDQLSDIAIALREEKESNAQFIRLRSVNTIDFLYYFFCQFFEIFVNLKGIN